MRGVKDALGRLDGVHELGEVDLQRGLVPIVPANDEMLRLEAVPEAVRGAGFEPDDLRITAVGRFEGGRDGPVFRVRGWPRTHPVRPPDGMPEGPVRIEARVDIAADPPVLEPTGTEEVEAPEGGSSSAR